MATRVLVPLLGEGVEEVTVIKWLKQVGDEVRELEPLVEVNTDKVDTEIPSPATGVVLRIVSAEGAPAKVGELMAIIGKPGEGVEEEPSSKVMAAARPSGAKAASPVPPVRAHGEIGFVSPVVAQMAAEHGVDLAQVTGTGLGGRITKNDLLTFIERGGARAGTPAAKPAPAQGDQLVPHTLMRRQIAEHMLQSKHTSPHVLTVMEVDMSRVSTHRDAQRTALEKQGIKLTFTAYLICAIAKALRANPLVNSTWTDEGVLMHGAVSIGMATSLGSDGLIVPVIKRADLLSLVDAARAVNDLAARARAHSLQPDEVRGATFTLTNHGTGGSLFAMPIISQPQCAILGTGAIQKRVVAVTDDNGRDAVAVRPMLYLSLVFDHRILDGASADGFLTAVKQQLENWK